jgi:hypothetical protein
VRMALLFLLMAAGDENAAHPAAETQPLRNRRSTDLKTGAGGDVKEIKDPSHAAR